MKNEQQEGPPQLETLSPVEDASGLVFNLQRFSIHDGPGIRTTVFLKGCPLRCRWCHNPEGLESGPQLRFYTQLCTRCGRCQAVCPHGAHIVAPTAHTWDSARCTACGQCAAACMPGALEMVGSRMTVAEVMTVVRRDAPFYTQSGGGMTLSGGEPLAQWAFTRNLLASARDDGIPTALETSAYAPWARLEALLPLVDHWLVDIKETDDVRHQALTGVSNAHILANVRHLIEVKAEVILRIPWVPHYNADAAFLAGLLAFLHALPTIPPVELMPYHNLGQSKWTSLGDVSPITDDLPTVSTEALQPWIKALTAAGVEVIAH